MKLRKSKGEVYNGRYKNFKVNISKASIEHYYYLVDSDKHEITYNSLWGSEKFETVEEAKEASISYIDFAIK